MTQPNPNPKWVQEHQTAAEEHKPADNVRGGTRKLNDEKQVTEDTLSDVTNQKHNNNNNNNKAIVDAHTESRNAKSKRAKTARDAKKAETIDIDKACVERDKKIHTSNRSALLDFRKSGVCGSWV